MVAEISLQMEWGATLFWKFVFCTGKSPDNLYLPPRCYIHGGKELAVIGSIKSGAIPASVSATLPEAAIVIQCQSAET